MDCVPSCTATRTLVAILDEPTNYLDREGLGALVLAIKDYKGGVLIISHNKEFCDGVATEKWIMKGGYLRIEGDKGSFEMHLMLLFDS